ncbi:phage tail tape measure protein [Virgibacillus halodenitrificans]|uniref:phage tail tape measure protein n=1 Tax=Virgibacillus halodenitrificans TaxID=1482 RepID=UPI00136A3138|nr:phage tail tape measure protein [Virgibacillus halodenitrificans]MYL44584.1 phage tail tape measure protein [Virgibacillus halodenitrificans]
MATVRELQAQFVANISNMQSGIQNVARNIDNLGKKATEVSNKMSDSLDKAGKKMKAAGSELTKKVTAPLAVAGGAAFKFAVDQDKAFAKVSTLLQGSEKDYKKYKKSIVQVSDEMGVSFEEYSEAVYGSISAGIEQGEAVGFAGKMAKLAKGGFTDMATATDVVTTALNAYGMDVKETDTIMDQLINTQNLGKTTVDELASSMGAVIPVAQAQGVTFDQLSTGYAVLTKNGIATSEAGTYMKSMLSELGKAGSEVDKILREKTGKSFSELQGEGKTVGDVLGVLQEEADNSGVKLSDMFGSVEAGSAALVLAKSEGKEFEDVLKTMGDVGGATDEAFGKVNKTIGERMKKAFNEAKNSAAELGEILFPIAEKGIGLFSGMVNKLKDLPDGLKQTIVMLGIFVAALGPLLLGMGVFTSATGKVLGVIGKFGKKGEEAGGIIKTLGNAFKLLTGPIGITIAIITALTTGFIIAYKKSEKFRNFVNGLKGVFLSAVSGVKEFLQTNPKMLAFFDSVESAIKTMGDFFKSKITEIKSFWDTNGASLLKAFKNIFVGILAVIKPVLGFIVSAVKFSLPIVQKVFSVTFKVVLALLKSIWGNIQGVIDGGLKFIMGLIQVFSGLFTGNFRKMWTGIKNIFTGAIQFIWNFVQLMFWGKMLKGIVSLGKLLLNAFKGSWTKISNLFSTIIKWIVDFVKNRFTSMRNTISNLATGTKNILSKIWNSILSFFKSIIKNIVDFVLGRFTVLRNRIQTTFNTIKITAQKIWSSLKNFVVDTVKKLVDTAHSKFTGFKNITFEIFRNIRDKVKGYVTDMVDAVKNMPGRMKDGLVKMGGKVKDGAISVANKMASGLGKGVNGVISGVNWVMGKLGVDSKLKKWEVPQYARGTKGHMGGPAIVGDGKGSNSGSELITTPDGNSYLSPAKDTLVNLPRGTHVMPASLTKRLIPQYAWGTELWKGTKKVVGTVKDVTVNAGKAVGRGAKAAGSRVAEWTGNVWDYAKNPGKLLNIALKAVGVKVPNSATTLGKIAKGGFTTVKDKAVGFIKDKMNSLFNFGSDASGNVKSWISQAMGHTGVPANWAGPLATIAMKESGGRTGPSTINRWDSNWLRGTPSMGLMQTIRPTFEAYKGKGMNDIMNPVHNAVAAINYIKKRYGSVFNVPGIRNLRNGLAYVGYENGGIVDRKQLAWLAEGGWAESVISHDPAKRVSQQKIWQQTGDMLGFTDKHKEDVQKGMKEIIQNITINSPTPLSPSEIARKNLQASRRLAMEWGSK